MAAVPEPPHKHGTVHSGVGYSRPRVVPVEIFVKADSGLVVRTRDAQGVSDKNFFIGRVKRNLLEQSYVGALFTEGDPGRPLDGRTIGGDLRLATSPSVEVRRVDEPVVHRPVSPLQLRHAPAGQPIPFERFEKYSPYGTPEDVAEFLAPYAEAGCATFNLIPQADDHDAALAGAAAVKKLLART